MAVAGSAAVLLASAVGLGAQRLGGAARSRRVREILLASAVAFVPVMAVVALAVALYGLLPVRRPARCGPWWATRSWSVCSAACSDCPQWAMDISPFALVPMMPAEGFTPWPVLGMLAVSALLAVAGVWGLRRRDLRFGG